MRLDELRALLARRTKEVVPEATTVSREGGGMREAVMKEEEIFLQFKGKCPDCLHEMGEVDRDALAGTRSFRCLNCGVSCVVSEAAVRACFE